MPILELRKQNDLRVVSVKIDEDQLSVELMEGRSITVPLAWYPRLVNATQSQREHWELCGAGYGIHRPEIDEDLAHFSIGCHTKQPRRQYSSYGKREATQ